MGYACHSDPSMPAACLGTQSVAPLRRSAHRFLIRNHDELRRFRQHARPASELACTPVARPASAVTRSTTGRSARPRIRRPAPTRDSVPSPVAVATNEQRLAQSGEIKRVPPEIDGTCPKASSNVAAHDERGS
jgi:hypothetical protein